MSLPSECEKYSRSALKSEFDVRLPCKLQICGRFKESNCRKGVKVWRRSKGRNNTKCIGTFQETLSEDEGRKTVSCRVPVHLGGGNDVSQFWKGKEAAFQRIFDKQRNKYSKKQITIRYAYYGVPLCKIRCAVLAVSLLFRKYEVCARSHALGKMI